jgi:uncharacterized protein with HEPN domain
MPKDDQIYLGQMIDLAEKIVQKIQGVDRAAYDADENLRLALTHLIQTIGEAARRVSEAFQQANPQIPWQQIIGIRHKVVHDYMHVDFDIVWAVATVDLPPLIAQLKTLQSPYDASGSDV